MRRATPQHTAFSLRPARGLVLCLCAAALGCGSDPGTTTPDAAAGSGSQVMASSSAGKPASAASPSAGSGGARAGSGAAASGGTSGSKGQSSTPAGQSGASGSSTSASAAAAGGTAASAGSSASQAGASGSTPTAGTAAAGSGGAGAAGGGASTATGAALSDMQTLIPDKSWDCGMPDGIPGPATGDMVFEIDFTVKEVHDIGQTQFGHRQQIDVSGGKVSGGKLDATLMDRGLDYQLTLDNGAVELEQIHILQAGGTPVYMRNCGVAASSTGPVRVVLDFEAPTSSSVSWLNMGTYIGTREFDAASMSLHMKVYQVNGAADKANAVTVPAAPAGPHNTWDCKKASGSKGSEVYMESVGIGDSVAVGDSKRGTRNIIPITGGTATGMIAGDVFSGGADFQLSTGGQFILDARYTVKTSDGDLIIVRNCGPIGALVPVFETAKDGKHGFVTQGDYLSSDPGISVGAVNLTIYNKN